jgi:hypothetical protein
LIASTLPTSIRVRGQPQQRRRVQIIDLNCLEWCFSADIVPPTAWTRPRSQSKSERCRYYSVKRLVPASIASTHVRSQSTPSLFFRKHVTPCCSLLHTHSYTTRPWPSAQKAGIPTNPLSPLLFILSSSRLCDKVLSEDAVSFNAPYFRAEVAPLFVSSLPLK